MIVDEKGEKEDAIDIENELVKFIRKNPARGANYLKIKYGKSWSSRF